MRVVYLWLRVCLAERVSHACHVSLLDPLQVAPGASPSSMCPRSFAWRVCASAGTPARRVVVRCVPGPGTGAKSCSSRGRAWLWGDPEWEHVGGVVLLGSEVQPPRPPSQPSAFPQDSTGLQWRRGPLPPLPSLPLLPSHLLPFPPLPSPPLSSSPFPASPW